MSKFNRAGAYTAKPGAGPIKSELVASGLTHEGGQGFKRDVKSELFLMAVGSFFGEDTFYENAADKDQRFKDLVKTSTIQDREWTAKFLKWLRNEGNIRTASIVGAVEFYKASQPNDKSNPQAHDGLNRQVIRDVLVRADEPGEMLAYHASQYGKSFGGGLKRGIADAAKKMYEEYNLLKWDGDASSFRFGDVVELAHPKPKNEKQSQLFRHAIDRRHKRDDMRSGVLEMISARDRLMSLPVGERRRVLTTDTQALKDAGMTWESLAGWLQGPMNAEAWEAIIPSMGYMALLRNLRNFDEAGISKETKLWVGAKLANHHQVAMSRQFPFRFFAAYEKAPSLFWGEYIDEALNHSLSNIPELSGRTAIFIDTSGSMESGRMSKRSDMSPAKAAAIFGVALGCKSSNVDVFGFADGTFKHNLTPGMSVLKEIEKFRQKNGSVGWATDFQQAVRYGFNGHDRVFMISDMQTLGTLGYRGGYSNKRWDEMIPANVSVYGYNLGGYKHGAMPTGPNRQEFGGLSDATFRQIPLLEKGKNAQWPWEESR